MKISWLQRMVIQFLASRVDWGSFPPEGRSSSPTWAGFGSGNLGAMVNDYIAPPVPFELTEALERAWLYNPMISQAVKNWTNMANTGHSVVLDGPDARVDRALEILNQASHRIYTRSAGVDGLINHMLDQVAITGAVSAEDVVDMSRREISEVALVPTVQVRFREVEGKLLPFQKVSGVLGKADLLPLNPNTFAMYCLQVYRDSPYPRPPMCAAIKPLVSELQAWENLAFILQKLGLLGLVRVLLKPPAPKPGEEDSAYESRKGTYLSKALTAFLPNFRKGLMVGYDDVKVEHNNITGDASGARDIWQTVEEQLCSGIGTSPAMMGRNYTTTETYASVIYNILVRDGENSQRLVKRRVERTYRLELNLKGADVDGVSLQFQESPHLNPYPEALAESTRVRTAVLKAEKGMADPDEIAQEMGYDSWFDAEKLLPQQTGGFSLASLKSPLIKGETGGCNRRKFRYDRKHQKYVFQRERIAVRNAAGACRHQSPLIKGETGGCSYSAADDAALRELEDALTGYAEVMRAYLDETRAGAIERALTLLRSSTIETFPEAESFAAGVLEEVRAEYLERMATAQAKKLSSAEVASLYERFKTGSATAFDAGAPIAFEIGAWDKRAIGFMGDIDGFFFSKFVDNETMKSPVMTFLREQFLENGEGLLGRLSPETVAAFRDLFEDKLENVSNRQVRGIIDHSVQRIRNWSSGRQMQEAGIEYAEVVAVMDDRTSAICKYMNKKRIPIGVANTALDTIMAMSPEQYLDHLKAVDPAEYFKANDVNTIAAEGRGFPPYHAGGCRTRLKAVVE